MNPLVATIQALLSSPAITDICEDRIHPVLEEIGTVRPNIVVYVVNVREGYNLDGPHEYPESRVSVEVRAADAPTMDRLGDAVWRVLSGADMNLGSTNAVFFKEGSDVQDISPDFSVFRRIIDFRVRTRSIGS